MCYKDIGNNQRWRTCGTFISAVLSLYLMLVFWKNFTNSRVIDGTWDVNAINNCTNNNNPSTNVLECNKRYGSGLQYLYLGLSIMFLVSTVLQLVFCCKPFNSSTQQLHQELTRTQECALERPVVSISTVSRDYGIRNASNIDPSAPPSHIIIAEADAPPPEYIPPPAYNECAMNKCDYDRRIPSSGRTVYLLGKRFVV